MYLFYKYVTVNFEENVTLRQIYKDVTSDSSGILFSPLAFPQTNDVTCILLSGRGSI